MARRLRATFFQDLDFLRVFNGNTNSENQADPRKSDRKCDHFAIDQIRRRRRQGDAGASAGLASLVVCQTHHTHRIHGGVAMPQALVETLVAIVTFSVGIPARVEFWSCLLCKASGEPLFSRIRFT